MIIASIRVEQLRLPLKVPYKLAFGPLEAFDVVLFHVMGVDGELGWGESTIVTGYTPETVEGCWRGANELAQAVVGADHETAIEQALQRHHDMPFTVSGLNTAIEMAVDHPLLRVADEAAVPLLAILNADDEGTIPDELLRHADAGYQTVKVKVGFDCDRDLARVAFIQANLPVGMSIRIDGNQGFSPEDGVRFAAGLAPESIELLEQPCHMDDWDAAKAVADVATVPMMLDESIYGMDEIERAAELGASAYIKLKLMKAGGLTRLADQLQRIRDLGMKPVLGNGVATDIGCWMECCVARQHIDNAGEMNGFLKPVMPLFIMPMIIADGAARLAPGIPRLDRRTIDAHTIESLTHGRDRG